MGGRRVRATWLLVGRVKRKQHSHKISAGPGPRKHGLVSFHNHLQWALVMPAQPIRTETEAWRCGEKRYNGKQSGQLGVERLQALGGALQGCMLRTG